MTADDHARGKQREADDREEEEHVPRIDHSFVNALEVRHDAEGRDRLHKPWANPFVRRFVTGGNQPEPGKDK